MSRAERAFHWLTVAALTLTVTAALLVLRSYL